MTATEGYDIIGDIHGQAGPLRRLLDTLGYRERHGAYSYPGGHRQAVFVGDYIDRNPDARDVIDIVQRMTAEGEALAAMGNHEFNAVAYHTTDPDRPGGFLRPHTPKNEDQHRIFLGEMEGDQAAHDAAIDWFRTLPMWLDLGELRIVHAAWVERHQQVLGQAAGPEAHLSDELLVAASRKGTRQHAAVECLLKGLEADLPDAAGYRDSYGIWRTNGRVRWWLNEPPRHLRDALIGAPAMVEQLGEARWSGPWPADAGYRSDAPPVFIGHYWLDGDPAPLAPNVACVDYSAARPGGKLTAYRWDGESRLAASRYVSVAT